jgi:hypothetical protein
MKKHLSAFAVTVILLSLPFISSAQIEQGKIVVGGSIQYNKRFYPTSEFYSSSGYFYKNSSKSSNFSSEVNFGYMISDRFELGFYLGYSKSLSSNESITNTSIDKNKSTSGSFAFGPSFRYYHSVLADKLYLFGQFQSGFTSINGSSKSNHYYTETDTLEFSESKQKNTALYSSISPGINYSPTKWLSIELIFGRIGWNYNLNNSNDSEFDIGLTLRNLGLGSRFFF